MRFATILRRSLAATVATALVMTGSVSPGFAQSKRQGARVGEPTGSQRPTREVWLSIGEGERITLPSNVAEDWTSNPEVADVYVSNPRQINLFGKAFGEALAARGLDQVNCQPFNVALPRIEHVDLARVDVKAKDLKAHLGKTKRQRQADVTQAIDADHSSLVGNPGFESLKSVHGWKGNGCWVVVTAHVKKCACHVQN